MTAVIAHRGASAEAPENSLAALDLAMQLGADAIELDVQRTVDGSLVVFHDPTLDRMTDASGRIDRLTSDQVAGARLRGGGRVPELEVVLRRFPGVEITVDVKHPAAADDVVALIRTLDREADTILYVEDGTATAAFRGYEGRRATSTGQALRLAREPNWPAAADEGEIPEVIHTPMGRDGAVIVTQAFVRRVRDIGRSVQVWTIDDVETARHLAAWGTDGIITNDVRRIRAALDAHARQREQRKADL